ncbi:hypothetical protein M5X00_29315 [Paenibacillus alvei]|uniref:hypothetical protein n=1 Tax=Paenibacillus alvei TaxID=44250 RepID=UPI002280E4C5|nr:hypothetical protein [Paenibacillus alvei]MCY9732159.1 hypothetical protein [Paenibacillus alvei]MCY9758319.1 hypothetical protein [Paenibacillus alvei]
MNLELLAKQTSNVMVQEIERLMTEMEEPIQHLHVKTVEEWVKVFFVLAEIGFAYTYNKKTREYDSEFMALASMQYFKEKGI